MLNFRVLKFPISSFESSKDYLLVPRQRSTVGLT